MKRNIQYYQCCPEPYYDLVFTFVIRRRALYYGKNILFDEIKKKMSNYSNAICEFSFHVSDFTNFEKKRPGLALFNPVCQFA